MNHPRLNGLRIAFVALGFIAISIEVSKNSKAIAQSADMYQLNKRAITQIVNGKVRTQTSSRWDPKTTAVIVCDVWDYHHSINAVRRLEEMLPSMEKLLKVARDSGSIVIHSPSDCMPHYEGNPARIRAQQVPKNNLPPNIASWNCKITQEEAGVYPLDQSDGGEDDDPIEHQQWAQKLKALGRDPGLPWKTQNPALTIVPAVDYVSDRGDEVWAILKENKIEHVIMLGVHTNMCVLGRPFGLRQLVSQQVDVVLVRDLTDCMYNPKRWPFVDHYTGNELMIGYVEEHICPTVTSDQIIGGKPVVFVNDKRTAKYPFALEVEKMSQKRPEWELTTWKKLIEQSALKGASKILVRCSLRIPPESFSETVTLKHPRIKKVWLNGHQLELSKGTSSLSDFEIVASQTFGNDDANVLVLEIDASQASQNPQILANDSTPVVMSKSGAVTLQGDLQFKSFSELDQADTNLPLPAKFALPPAVYYSLP
jgi:nicotinamidase-related amidase